MTPKQIKPSHPNKSNHHTHANTKTQNDALRNPIDSTASSPSHTLSQLQNRGGKARLGEIEPAQSIHNGTKQQEKSQHARPLRTTS